MREHARDGRARTDQPAVHSPAVEAPVRRPHASADVLALQRSAGNQAVGRWLARDSAVEELDTGTKEKLGEWRVTVSKVGAFAADSVNWGGTLGERGDLTMSDVTIAAAPGPHAPKLMTLFFNSTPIRRRRGARALNRRNRAVARFRKCPRKESNLQPSD
jgi:hypothetical protein